MDRVAQRVDDSAITALYGSLAPRPRTVEETGLSAHLLGELVLKHLHAGGVLTLRELVERLGLAGPVVESVIRFLRTEALVEVRGGKEGSGLRYALTDLGRKGAHDAFDRSGYIGIAPVTLAEYTRVVTEQSVHDTKVARESMHDALSDVVLTSSMVDQLGPALNSGRAIFVYGPAGTGKTYISQRLVRLFTDTVLIPYAIAVNETVIEVFDPVIHRVADENNDYDLRLEQGHDLRYARCQRPEAISGGELTLDMLEVQYDPGRKLYRAPLQLKANNGIYIIDDMGRQRVDPADLLNRWIVPLEEKRDFHALDAGRHFAVPFDVVLVFSTNLNPLELADEAFLRRIGYKIRFDHLDREAYSKIWRDVCAEKGVEFDPVLLEYVLSKLHGTNKMPLLPCHPRDLLSNATDYAQYMGRDKAITATDLDWAWNRYFVSLGDGFRSDQMNTRNLT